MSKNIFFAVCLATLVSINAANAVRPPEEVWNKTYSSGNAALGRGVVVDPQGNVYVLGVYDNGSDNDFLTIKYDPAGTVLWYRVFDCGDDDEPGAITLDAEGNVYVCGSFVDTLAPGTVHARLLKYSPLGDSLLNVSYDLSDSIGLYALTFDQGGALYLAGYTSNPTNSDYLIAGCDPVTGDTLWIKVYDSGREESVEGIAVDTSGNIYVTGTAGADADTTDVRTIKYNPGRSLLWNELFDAGGYDDAGAIALDGKGNVLVGLASYNVSGNADYRLVKYDSGGGLVWNKYYDAGSDDFLADVVCDSSGNAYITGMSQSGPTNSDIRTMKYTPSGDVEWYKVFDSGTLYDAIEGDGADGIALDGLGYVYVTGYHGAPGSVNIRTIKYRQFFTISGNTGEPLATLNLTGAAVAQTSSDSSGNYQFPDLACGNVYTVTPTLEGFNFIPSSITYAPLVDHMLLEDYTAAPVGVEEQNPSLEAFLDVDALNLRYSVPESGFLKLIIYDACGRKVVTLFEGNGQSGVYNVSWKPQASGIYFARLEMSGKYTSCKVAVIK